MFGVSLKRVLMEKLYPARRSKLLSITKSTLRLGIAGLGNVGVGLVKLVQMQDQLRLPGRLEITGVSARSRSRDRGINIADYAWSDDAMELATSDQVDVYVELIGGADGPAKLTVEAALNAGKHVVTANKALIAEHGLELAQLAEANDVELLFEAGVAGGIPIVRSMRDSLSGVVVDHVSGILNGTCNYILTEMLDTAAPYGDVLKDAQRLGYAEADPYLDVSGMDAAHKIVILAALAFGARPDFSKVRVQGIEDISDQDIQLSAKLGYRIRLVAEATRMNGSIRCFVAPALFPEDHPLAHVTGPTNAVLVKGEPLGQVTFTGPGAGEGPTASAVMGDISRLLQGGRSQPFGIPSSELQDLFSPPTGDGPPSRWFLRARLADQSGALASLSEALADSDVSIDKLIQDSSGDTGASPIAIVTHACSRMAAETARKRIASLEESVDAPQLIRIEA